MIFFVLFFNYIFLSFTSKKYVNTKEGLFNPIFICLFFLFYSFFIFNNSLSVYKKEFEFLASIIIGMLVFKEIVNESQFVLNSYVTVFESHLAVYTNQKYSVSCANGTDALDLILRALNIGIGDEVILPTNSFIANSIAVSRCGAKPVFVDNDEFYLIDVNSIKKRISKKTKAIIAVNLYGQMANLKQLSNIAKKNGVYLIEDAAQSHGAKDIENKVVGDYSIAAAYSFYPGKNLGAWGDGGAVTTNSKQLMKKMTAIRSYGSEKKYYHKITGCNSRLDTIQAAILNVKLKHLDNYSKSRNEMANIYDEAFKDIDGIQIPKRLPN